MADRPAPGAGDQAERRAGALAGRTVVVTGASRGIGRAMALRFARDGANVAIAAKTAEPHPRLEGTIHTVAAEVEEAGGRALPLEVDIRDEDRVEEAVAETVEAFGGVDVLVNNASAIHLSGLEETPVRRYDLVQDVNARGTFVCSRAAMPHLRESGDGRVLTISPPLTTDGYWYGRFLAYTMSKYGMTMCTLGIAEEYREAGVWASSLWPRTTIATAAVEVFFPEHLERSRTPAIMADAAYEILTRPGPDVTGRCFMDEDVLREAGVEDFARYAVDPTRDLQEDLLLP